MATLATNSNNPIPAPPNGTRPVRKWLAEWTMPILTLAIAYSLLLLTFTKALPHAEMMQRCVLADPKLSRIWSVGNVEIGLAYFGVFGAMLFYFVKIYRNSKTHIRDMAFALGYLFGSFVLDFICVETFEPFIAMLVGDAMVMTFTLIVSRQIWFQRLLGVFVPLIFLTCGVGHFLEGLSYWQLTYHLNVPWTMVTADIGFAVLVNASRYPAFIRGEDILTELSQEKIRADELATEVTARKKAEEENILLITQLERTSIQQRRFLRDVLSSVTEGRLRYCETLEDLPTRPGSPRYQTTLTSGVLRELRHAVADAIAENDFEPMRVYDVQLAVGEAAMNAVNHASGGMATVYYGAGDNPFVQVWIEDNGGGIDLANLPRATLEPGYSSAGTLGQGFYLMLRTADTVWLRTTPNGTTIVIEQAKYPAPQRSPQPRIIATA